ncbi:hypothetical protein FS842_007284, partial [Serendipita sp. 407]
MSEALQSISYSASNRKEVPCCPCFSIIAGCKWEMGQAKPILTNPISASNLQIGASWLLCCCYRLSIHPPPPYDQLIEITAIWEMARWARRSSTPSQDPTPANWLEPGGGISFALDRAAMIIPA